MGKTFFLYENSTNQTANQVNTVAKVYIECVYRMTRIVSEKKIDHYHSKI